MLCKIASLVKGFCSSENNIVVENECLVKTHHLHSLTCAVVGIELSFRAETSGGGEGCTLADSGTSKAGTGELAFLFSVPVGPGETSLLLLVDSVETKNVLFSLLSALYFTPGSGVNIFWFC